MKYPALAGAVLAALAVVSLALAGVPDAAAIQPAVAGSILVPPAEAAPEPAPKRPHAVWAAIRFTIKEYELIPFARLRELGVGTIFPHFGRLRVLANGRVELYDFYGNVIWPDHRAELKKMVARLHQEGFRVIPWLSVKRAKPEGSFWIYDNWAPLVKTVKSFVTDLKIDGFQLDPEPLNVCDVTALNTGLGWLKRVLRERELGVATPKLVPGTPDIESGYQWGGVEPFAKLTNADALYLMTYDTRAPDPAAYARLLDDNLAVARKLCGSTRVYLGLPAYPADPPPKPKQPRPGQPPEPPRPPAHAMPPEEGHTFARALLRHKDLGMLAGVAVYDLEEPGDAHWLAAWTLAEDGLAALNKRMR